MASESAGEREPRPRAGEAGAGAFAVRRGGARLALQQQLPDQAFVFGHGGVGEVEGIHGCPSFHEFAAVRAGLACGASHGTHRHPARIAVHGQIWPFLDAPAVDFVALNPAGALGYHRQSKESPGVSITTAPSTQGGLPPFVGRSGEMARLRDLLVRAAEGSPCVVLVGGESGVGKSRLVREFLLEAELGGWQTVWCRYGRGFHAGDSALAGALSAQAERATPPPCGRSASSMEGRGPRGLSTELLRLATGLAERRPLALAVDDLHAADATELQLFGALAGGIADVALGKRLKLLVVATHQPFAAADQSRTTFQRLLREPVTQAMALDGLEEPEVSELLGSGLGAVCDVRLVEAVTRTTRGNPFFVIQLADVLGAPGVLVERGGQLVLPEPGAEVHLPGSAASSVVARFESLGEETLSVLRTAAVLGDEFSIEDLDALCDGVAVGAATDVAVAAGALEERPGGLAFAHEILRSAFEATVGPAQRRMIHLRMAERLGPGKAIAQAFHLLAAGGGNEPPAALGALYVRAADDAIAKYARSTARRLYEASLALPGFVSSLDPVSLGWLQCRAARACENDGFGRRARELYFAAIRSLRGSADVRAWGLAVIGWETTFTTAAEPIPTLAYEREFLAAAGGEALDIQARLLTQRADALQLARQPDDERVAQEAVEMARRSMSVEAIAAATATHGLTQMRRLDPVGALASFRAANHEAAAVDNPVVQAWGSARLAWPLIVLGRVSEADEAARIALGSARAAHDWAHGALSLAFLHSASLLRGEQAAARMHQSDCVRFADRSGYVQARFVLDAAVAWHRFLRAEFREALDAVSAWEQRAGRSFATPLRMLIQARLNDAGDAADSITSRGLRVPSRDELDFISLGPLCVFAELASERGATDIAQDVLAALQPVDSGRVVFSMCPPMLVARARAICWRVLGQREEALRELDIAAAQAAGAGSPIEAALVALERARLALAARRGLDRRTRDDLEASLAVFRDGELLEPLLQARQLLAEGRTAVSGRPASHVLVDELSVIEREVLNEFSKGAAQALIADRLLLNERTVESHLERLRLRLGIRTPADAAAHLGLRPVGSGRRRPWELTPREIEVLQLIAAGKTNQQIADELVISLHTAIRHVANILEKTGAANRTAVARLADDYQRKVK